MDKQAKIRINKRRRISLVTIKARFSKPNIVNNGQDIAVDKIISFANKYRIILSEDLDQYQNGKVSLKHLFSSIIMKMLCLVTSIRYCISALYPTKNIIVMMSDANYQLGNQRWFSILLCNGAMIVFVATLIILIYELKVKFYILSFLNDYKHNRLLPMNGQNSRKLLIRANLMARYLISQSFWPMVTMTNGLFNGSVVVAYFDSDSGFNLISVLACTIACFIWIIHLYALVGFI
jgi:type III secretion system FlhB-like substrate exporter